MSMRGKTIKYNLYILYNIILLNIVQIKLFKQNPQPIWILAYLFKIKINPTTKKLNQYKKKKN